MKFSATLFDTPYDSPEEFAAYLKANPLSVKPYALPSKPVVFKKPRVTLTTAEREWLGTSVRRSDGSVGQVWALAPERGYVWVVADGDHWFATHVGALTKLAGRLDQPRLGE